MSSAPQLPPQEGENSSRVPVYSGPELMRRLKDVRGVAYYSGHRDTSTKRLISKMASSVSRIQEQDDEGGSDEKKKAMLVGLVFLALIAAFMMM